MAQPNITKRAAIRAAAARLPIRRPKELRENLEMACGDLEEAYRLGAEEAQHEIVARLAALPEAANARR